MRHLVTVVLTTASLLMLAGCQREAATDPATVDAGATRNTPPGTEAGSPRSPTTLESGAQVLATPAAKALQDYLASSEPPGRRFRLQEVRFVGGQQVREDPNGSIATLVAILRAHPTAKVQIEVARPASTRTLPDAELRQLAENVAAAFVRNGLSADRVSASGALVDGEKEPLVFLVVTAK